MIDEKIVSARSGSKTLRKQVSDPCEMKPPNYMIASELEIYGKESRDRMTPVAVRSEDSAAGESSSWTLAKLEKSVRIVCRKLVVQNWNYRDQKDRGPIRDCDTDTYHNSM